MLNIYPEWIYQPAVPTETKLGASKGPWRGYGPLPEHAGGLAARRFPRI